MSAWRKPIPIRSINMSELQPESADIQESTEAIENPDNGAELATASESEHSTNTETVDEAESEVSKQQAYINKQYGEKKQLERDLAAQREQNARFQQAERERQAALVGNIPEMPDAFEDDYELKIKQRDEALVAQANYNAQNNAYLQQEQFNQQQAAQAQAVKVQESMTSYSSKATELGINQAELQAAGNKVANYGLSDDLVLHILSDPDGPLITKHLAEHAKDGYELASMSPFAVGQFLDGIKTKASALKPKTSSTPTPATSLQGNGVDPESGKYKNIGGAKFE